MPRKIMNKRIVVGTRRCLLLAGLPIIAGCSWKAPIPTDIRIRRGVDRGLDHRNSEPGPRGSRARQDDRELVHRRRVARPGLRLGRQRAGTIVLDQPLSSGGGHQ